MELDPANNLGGGASLVVQYGLALVGTLAVALRLRQASRRYAAMARQAAAAAKGKGALADGTTVLYGQVEIDGPLPPPPAIVITIHQDGVEQLNRNVWTHTWTETTRTCEASPFYLRTPAGERVRVEPDDSVFLVDRLTEPVVRRRDAQTIGRDRIARLDHAERVHVCGALSTVVDPSAPGAGYRDAPTLRVLRRTPTTRMLVSTEALDARYLRRASFFRRWSQGFVVALVALQLFALNYHRLLLGGQTVMARVTSHQKSQTWVSGSRGRGHYEQHYLIWTSYRDQTSSREIDGFAYDQVHDGDPVPMRIAAGGSIAELGRDATLPMENVYTILITLTALGLLLAWSHSASADWWDVKRLVDKGHGRLPRPDGEPAV